MPIDASLLNELTAGGAGAGLLAILKPAWKFWCAIRSGIIAEADLQNRDREAYERRIEQRENEAWDRAETERKHLAGDLREERARATQAEADCHFWKQTARNWEEQAHRMRHALVYVAGRFNALLYKTGEMIEGRESIDCMKDIVSKLDRIPSTSILPSLEQVNHPNMVPGLLPGEFPPKEAT